MGEERELSAILFRVEGSKDEAGCHVAGAWSELESPS